MILLCTFLTAIISKSGLGTQWTLKNRQKSNFGPTVIKLWENTLYYACYQNIHLTQNWSWPTKCTLWLPGSQMAIFKNRGGLQSHKANVGSLRVGVSDGDLVHQALLGRNCKIVLLSDFFFKIKMKT